ncbi:MULTISPECIES: DUF3343 domain-containing protein [Anaerotruncus]|jgi:hypothetical protein|uniref:DUF3343 domain-containing protein n=1 Tax=Anaerotruncus TaxID=244127 RepID=UPI000831CF59|nr:MULTISPECIES: DUF3343 domain-containing protein [Anaerotruncus]RGX53303.1 DUF3343 domain-containing protein [Anaerotruncus sp. AF02-27]
MRYGVIAFDSTHAAIHAEKRLKARCKVSMMPTPRQITASCGISIRFFPDDLGVVREELAALGSSRLYAIYGIADDGSIHPV